MIYWKFLIYNVHFVMVFFILPKLAMFGLSEQHRFYPQDVIFPGTFVNLFYHAKAHIGHSKLRLEWHVYISDQSPIISLGMENKSMITSYCCTTVGSHILSSWFQNLLNVKRNVNNPILLNALQSQFLWNVLQARNQGSLIYEFRFTPSTIGYTNIFCSFLLMFTYILMSHHFNCTR